MSRKRLSFAGVQKPEEASAHTLPTLLVALPPRNGRPRAADLTGYPDTPFVRDVADALRRAVQGVSGATARQRVDCTKHFLSWCRARAAAMSVETLTPQDIDAFVSARMSATALRGRRAQAAATLHVLKHLPEARLPAKTRDRLDYVSTQRRAASTPRPAYDAAYLARLRAACTADIAKVVERLVTEADALLAGGVDPREAPPESVPSWARIQPAWKVAANLAVYAAASGPLERRTLANRFGVLPFNLAQYGVNPNAVNAALYPSADDAVPFFLRFLDLTGISPAEGAGLRWDDIQWSKHSILVHTRKPRAGRPMLPRRFRDGNRSTPGHVLRLWRSASARLSSASGDDRVFIALVSPLRPGSTACTPFVTTEARSAKLMARFSKRHGLSENVQPARLRKTEVATRYVKRGGSLRDVAQDHSERVAYKHYLVDPSLQPLHEATVAEGIQDALDAVLTAATIVGNHGESADSGADEGESSETLTADHDVGLVQCRDVRQPPWRPQGEVCGEAVFGVCVTCRNAVITSRKLPNILSYLDQMLAARALLSPSEWEIAHGRHTRVIREAILPRFTHSVVQEAYAIARSESALPYLAPELFPPR